MLSSVFGPYAQDDEFGSRSINPMELYHNQVTREQGPFSLRMLHRSWGIIFIQHNISAPCLRAANRQGEWSVDDPYAYGPVLGPIDDWLVGEGTHVKLYDRLGAHPIDHEGAAGVHFRCGLRTRSASRSSAFNAWDGRCHVMRKRLGTGVWEIFIPALRAGAIYKYEIIGTHGALLPFKADPVGFQAELRPSTASIVCDTDNFPWSDGEWMAAGGRVAPTRAPMSLYEVHL